MGNWLLNRPEGLSQEGIWGEETTHPYPQLLSPITFTPHPFPGGEQNLNNLNFLPPKRVNEPLEKVFESIPADSIEAVWSIRIESGIGD